MVDSMPGDTVVGRHRRRAVRPASPCVPCRRRPRSSPPTAASTTPAPPGSCPTCWSATSTRCRRPGSTGRGRTSRSSATRPTRRRPTPSWRWRAPRRCARSASLLVAGRGDRLDHAIAALGALGGRHVGDVPSVEGWWGADHVLVARPGRSGGRRRNRPARRSRCSPCTARADGVTITGLALAADRRRPRPARRARRVQRGARPTVPCRRRRRRRHRHHPRSPTMKSLLLARRPRSHSSSPA